MSILLDEAALKYCRQPTPRDSGDDPQDVEPPEDGMGPLDGPGCVEEATE